MRKPLIIAGLFASVFMIVLIMSLSSQKEESNNTSPTPSASQSGVSPAISRGEIRVTNILPQETGRAYLPFQKITVSFSAPVELQTVLVSTDPLTEIKLLQGSSQNEIFIVPATTWRTGKTLFTISRVISRDTTAELANPVEFSLTTALPTLSPEELKDYP